MAKYINTDVLEVVGFTDQEGSFSDGVQWLLEYIDTLPSADVPHWIQCSERFPSDYVLFCDLDGDVYYGHRMDNKWWAEGCDDRIKNVIAWMPLPEPYKYDEQNG